MNPIMALNHAQLTRRQRTRRLEWMTEAVERGMPRDAVVVAIGPAAPLVVAEWVAHVEVTREVSPDRVVRWLMGA